MAQELQATEYRRPIFSRDGIGSCALLRVFAIGLVKSLVAGADKTRSRLVLAREDALRICGCEEDWLA